MLEMTMHSVLHPPNPSMVPLPNEKEATYENSQHKQLQLLQL